MKTKLLIIVLFFINICKVNSQTKWTFDAHFGNVYNIPTLLKINQANYPEIRHEAKFNTEGFTLPVYWNLRLGRWNDRKSIELELTHHKLYLTNTTQYIQKFNISHGFNILSVNRGFDLNNFTFRYGLGVAITHPESKIRNIEFGDSTNDFDMGYFISGPVANVGIGKKINITNWLYFNAETKSTFAYNIIKIADGKAYLYNIALHLTFGFGLNLLNSD